MMAIRWLKAAGQLGQKSDQSYWELVCRNSTWRRFWSLPLVLFIDGSLRQVELLHELKKTAKKLQKKQNTHTHTHVWKYWFKRYSESVKAAASFSRWMKPAALRYTTGIQWKRTQDHLMRCPGGGVPGEIETWGHVRNDTLVVLG